MKAFDARTGAATRPFAYACVIVCALLACALAGILFASPQVAYANTELKTTGKTSSSSVQTIRPAKVKDGLYQLRLGTYPKRVLAVEDGSLDNRSNVVVGKRKSRNAQKFVIRKTKSGYYRICSPLSRLAVSASGTSKTAVVRMERYRGKARQLWKAQQLPGGRIRFVNRKSGMVLAVKSAKSSTRAYVAKPVETGSSRLAKQGFRLVKTELNLKDRASYAAVAEKASKSSKVKVSNAVRGYTVNKKKWRELEKAVQACRFSIGFIMIDCNTGMMVSRAPDKVFFGASTIKGLYTTYLFEKRLENGRVPLSAISNRVKQTIIWSNNDTYRSLRANYGSQSGFNRWLKKVNVGSLGLWPSYSPRTLAKAWVNLLAYSNSKGKYVGFWKRTFDHSHMSSIHGALGKKRTTYSKPGWMTGGGVYGYKLNDGGVVVDRKGRQYVISILTSAMPYGQKQTVERVVKALDAIHADMPTMR